MMNLLFLTLSDLFFNIINSDLAINITSLMFAQAIIWGCRKLLDLVI